MSFGEGDLHGKVEAQAKRIDNLMETNGKLCDEINRQEKRIRELEDLVRDVRLTAVEYVKKHDKATKVTYEDAFWWSRVHIRERIDRLGL